MKSGSLMAFMAVLFFFCPLALPQEVVSPRVDLALSRGLEYLAAHQQPDGSFETTGPKSAITGLCVMAFLGSGHIPGDGRYGPVVRRGLEYLLKQFPDDGYVGRVDGSRMYGQGIITLALAEAYGVERDEARRNRIRACLQKSVEVIVAAQKIKKGDEHAGGWRYEPQAADSDLSLSGWNALALSACNNIGLSVNRQCITNATTYILRCYKKNEKGFAYQPSSQISPAMTGVGVLTLYLLEQPDRPEIPEAARYLASTNLNDDTRFPYYTLYYVTQAAFRLGGDTWTKLWKASSDYLVAHQLEDGSWPQSRTYEEPGRMYATAMALLTLDAPNRLVPVQQR